MTEHFSPISFERLLGWVLSEFDNNKTIFGIPDGLFYYPKDNRMFSEKYGKTLELPIGVAAGPHTQMAQNIISAWLCGARFIELKTVQTLDELKVSKPCIDMEDEGYNCEWSQELKIEQSFDEYLKAWVIIHILRDKLKHNINNKECGFIFNMSVGYNLDGIKMPNVQKFLDKMKDAGKYLEDYLKTVGKLYGNVNNIFISPCMSDNITLSTMHGCPPAEIENIASYLIKEKGFHTTIKFNPTLLGKEKIHEILNNKLGFSTQVPDIAFEHDPLYADALEIIRSVSKVSAENGKEFSFKLSNTLESINNKDVFPSHEKMMYMSGRPLHPIDVNLASKLINDLKGNFRVSFSGGADAFNVSKLIECNIMPVTVCSDILKPGGYGRLAQYCENIENSFNDKKAKDIDDFTVKSFLKMGLDLNTVITTLDENIKANLGLTIEKGILNNFVSEVNERFAKNNDEKVLDFVFSGVEANNQVNIKKEFIKICSMLNIKHYADEVVEDKRYYKDFSGEVSLKGDRELNAFDCISAPCRDTCPTNQNVPDYMNYTANGEFKNALNVIFEDNPLPNISGRICDHKCQTKCMRNNYDKSLAIREIKKFVTENSDIFITCKEHNNKKAAIIGGGPSGLSCAYFLAKKGFSVTVFEANSRVGGMASNAIPSFRLPLEVIEKDVAKLKSLGVLFKLNHAINNKEEFEKLRGLGFDAIYIATGAPKGLKMGILGEDSEGVYDAINFLYLIRNNKVLNTGKRIGIIGGGNSAIDAARTAWRLNKDNVVTLIYRRTEDEMPADFEEIKELKEEGIQILELTQPLRVIAENDKVVGLECIKMQLGEPDESKRRRPVPVKNSEFVIELDTIITAIGQKTSNGFLEESGVVFKNGETIVVDPLTQKTNVKGVFAGGDVVRGPSTLINAIGDGKRSACLIAEENVMIERQKNAISKNEFLEAKSKRVYPLNQKIKDASQRRNFEELVFPLSREEAVNEAKRCLMCDRFCSVCVTVCPNRANVLFEIEPFKMVIPELNISFNLEQRFQILNIGDFCNECGNCMTFCPTEGAPYKKKPKVYLNKVSFMDNEEDAFFPEIKDGKLFLTARLDGNICTITENEKGICFESPYFNFILADGFIVKELKIKENIKPEILPIMYVVMRGLDLNLGVLN